MAGVGEVTQSVAVERHQRSFGTGKERRQEQEEHQCAEQGTEGRIVQEGIRFSQSGSLSMSPDGRAVSTGASRRYDWQRFAR